MTDEQRRVVDHDREQVGCFGCIAPLAIGLAIGMLIVIIVRIVQAST